MRLVRRYVAGAVGVALATTATVLLTSSSAHAADVELWAAPAGTSIFRDTVRPPGAEATVKLDVARNEYEAGQIIVRSSTSFTINRVSFSSLNAMGPDGPSSIAASNLSYNFVKYTRLDSNSFRGNERVAAPIRIAPGDFPDALSNDTSVSVAATTTQPIWVRLFVPGDATPGVYYGTATVETNAGNFAVPLTADVRDVYLPNSSESTFTNTMWHLFFGDLSWQAYPTETIKYFYGHDRFSAGWWQLLGNVAEQMRQHRTNNLTIPLVNLLLDGGTTVDASGRYTFDWTRYDELARFMMERAGVRRLEGFWMNGGPHYNTYWDAEIIDRDPATGKAFRAYVPWDSAKATNFINQFIPAVRDHIRGKGWESVWWMHIGDEPRGDHGEAAWIGLSTQVRSHWPNVKLGDAAFHDPWASRLASRADIVIPNLLNYDWAPQAFDQARAAGKELWLYNCNIPQFGYLNRGIDQPQWHQRLTMWFAYQRGATGYLHWAMNNWHMPMNDQEIKGDGYIMYPDRARNTVEVTTRYESMRDGIEDWEVLNILGRTNPDLAKQLARSLVQTSQYFTQDVEYMARIRKIALDAAAGRPVIAEDLASNRPASASGTGSGQPSAAVDGDAGTSWGPSSGNTTQWLQVDLGTQAQVDGVRLQWAGPHATQYKIQLSYDGTAWSDEESTSRLAETAGNGGEDFIGVSGRGRYVRLRATASSGGTTAYRLASMEVSGRALPAQNVLGGRTYTKSSSPLEGHKDFTGRESSDGVTSTGWDDHRGYGYFASTGNRIGVDVTFDLGSIRELNRVRAHTYGVYHWYRAQTMSIYTSVDNVNWALRGTTSRPNDLSLLWYDFEFGAAGVRYVRFSYSKVSGPGDEQHLFLDEMEAYAAPTGGAPPCYRVQERPLPGSALLQLWACPSPRPTEFWYHAQLSATAPGQLRAGDTVSLYYYPYSRGIVPGTTVGYSSTDSIQTPSVYAGFQEIQACANLAGTFYCAWY